MTVKWETTGVEATFGSITIRVRRSQSSANIAKPWHWSAGSDSVDACGDAATLEEAKVDAVRAVSDGVQKQAAYAEKLAQTARDTAAAIERALKGA